MSKNRYYQQAAEDAVFAFWRNGGGNPLIESATGTGKSVMVANVTRRIVETYPRMRVLMLTHVKELVEQNAKAMIRSWPNAPIGINSASLGRRDQRSQILFASIQSVYRIAHLIGPFDVVLIDEAHLIPKSDAGMYLTLLAALREQMPDMRVVGFTATPYRLDSGRLDEGEGALFDATVFEYTIGQAVDEGYLVPLVSKATILKLDLSGVGKRGSEFIDSALQAAVDRDDVTVAACAEVVRWAESQARRSWLFFCSGVAHAEHVRDELQRLGYCGECVTGETPTAQRDEWIRAFREGRLQFLTNANVLTTGFDAPCVDLIAMLRPTLSRGLYMQMLGRGTRPISAPPEDVTFEERVQWIRDSAKPDCLVLDFAGNVSRHGPVDERYESKKKGKVKGKDDEPEVRAKECKACASLNKLSARVCIHCDTPFPPAEERINHTAEADASSVVMQRDLVDDWLDIDYVGYAVHRKVGKPDSLRVEYNLTMNRSYRSFICLNHEGFARTKARNWWRAMTGVGTEQIPAEIPHPDEAREILPRPVSIKISKRGEYFDVTHVRILRNDGTTWMVHDEIARPWVPDAPIPDEAPIPAAPPPSRDLAAAIDGFFAPKVRPKPTGPDKWDDEIPF